MMESQDIEQINFEVTKFFTTPNAYRSILILIAAIIIAYVLSRFLAQGIVKIAQIVGTKSDSMTNYQKKIRYRQIETYLSVAIASVRAVVVAIVAYITWRLLSPVASSSAAAIGASAFFIVFAGQTLGPVLRDVTTGATMIIEGWFHVGDYIKVEPFIDVSGVVERFTLRSTKLRRLSGEVVWIHNQHIQAAHVTTNGVRTYAIDLFTRDKDTAAIAINDVIESIPTGSTMVTKPLRFGAAEAWGDDLWRIVVEGRTAPGREWVIENLFVNAIAEIDRDKKKNQRLFVYEPIARFADPAAEREFKRAIRNQ